MKRNAVVFTSKCKAEFIEEEFDAGLQSDQVLVKSDYDIISAGTELANFRQLPNTETFYKGFPHRAGYSVSGHVLEVGPEVKNLRPGDRVVVPWGGHHSHVKKNETKLCLVPDGVSQQDVAFAHLASFPMLGVRKLNIQMGESTVVAGLGLLGLFAVQFARLSGAYPVIGCDYSPERRQKALELGADVVLDPADPDFVKKILELTGRGADTVVEVTGYISALKQALEYVAFQGRITLLGCTRVSDETIDYYKYVHRRGIALIGCHTMTRPKLESRPGQWTELDDYTAFLKYLKAGRVKALPVASGIRPASEGAEIFRMLDELKNPPCGILMDWTAV